MDFLLAVNTIANNVKLPEFFDASDAKQPAAFKSEAVYIRDRHWFPRAAGYVTSFLIGAFAAYLSWTCNSAMNTPLLAKVVWASIAAFFGLAYLLIYAFAWSSTCYIVSSKSSR